MFLEKNLKLVKKINLRYLIVGIFNTVFSYVLSVLIYYQLELYFHLLLISFITYALTISFSFFTYKCFVFKTKAYVLKEFFKFSLVYGAISFFSILSLWILVDFLLIKFWIAQGGLVLAAVILSYGGNKGFVFNVNK